MLLKNPKYIKERIRKRLRDSFYFLLAKYFFHFISLFSTTMMLMYSLPEWLRVPLNNIGIDLTLLERQGYPIFLYTAVTSVMLSYILEISSTKTMSGTFDAVKRGDDIAILFIRAMAISLLTATQLYTFVGGAKNTVIMALVPSAYVDEVNINKARVEHYKTLEEKLSIKINEVKEGKRKIDDNYGSGNTEDIKKLEKEYKSALLSYKKIEALEKKKKINLNKDGSFTRIARALMAEKYNAMVRPLEERLNASKVSKKDAKKVWLESAEKDLAKIRFDLKKYQDELVGLQTRLNGRIAQINNKIKDSYYWIVAVFVFLALSAMDYMHNRSFEDALRSFDNAKNSDLNAGIFKKAVTVKPPYSAAKNEFKTEMQAVNETLPEVNEDLPEVNNKETDDFKPSVTLEDIDKSIEEAELQRYENDKKKVEAGDIDIAINIDKNTAILNYIKEVYEKTGEVPSAREIIDELILHPRDVTKFYKDKEELFIVRKGEKTRPTDKFFEYMQKDY